MRLTLSLISSELADKLKLCKRAFEHEKRNFRESLQYITPSHLLVWMECNFDFVAAIFQRRASTVIISQPSAFQWSSVKLLCYNDRMGRLMLQDFWIRFSSHRNFNPNAKLLGAETGFAVAPAAMLIYGFMNCSFYTSLRGRFGLNTGLTERPPLQSSGFHNEHRGTAGGLWTF